MREHLFIVLFLVKFSLFASAQLAIGHNGVTVFSSENYLGAREHVETGSAITFVIRSVKIWPGYAAKLYDRSQGGTHQYFSTSSSEIEISEQFDLVEVLPGGDYNAPPAYSGPFYCIVTGGASVKMKAYLEVGVHNVEEELGGNIASIECAAGYSCVQAGPHTIEVTPLSSTRVYSKKNYSGLFMDLPPGAYNVRDIPFVIKSCYIPAGDSWMLEIEGVTQGVVIKKVFNFPIDNLSASVQGAKHPKNVGLDILSIDVGR